MSGRRPINSERMKPNGLTAELDNWFRDRAKSMGMSGGMELKRKVLEDYRRETESGLVVLDTPQNLASGE